MGEYRSRDGVLLHPFLTACPPRLLTCCDLRVEARNFRLYLVHGHMPIAFDVPGAAPFFSTHQGIEDVQKVKSFLWAI